MSTTGRKRQAEHHLGRIKVENTSEVDRGGETEPTMTSLATKTGFASSSSVQRLLSTPAAFLELLSSLSNVSKPVCKSCKPPDPQIVLIVGQNKRARNPPRDTPNKQWLSPHLALTYPS
ncbi:hypothetical protein CLCR_11227 [Cladophialophora carrionii]|uniref:Uncharacterized protein n=1 Tax=Cladophialophora carrionii TaxID=86049 RepID=A0A1C1C9R6_9EURO|nr:hypothetical protein CLCR_11227 [Cladophialophora carrionii]